MGKVYSFLSRWMVGGAAVFVLLGLTVTAVNCQGGQAAAPEPTAVPPTQVSVPQGVLAAQRAVLNFLREGANECVPPPGVEWRRELGPAPGGFHVYRMMSEGCFMTVEYPLPEVPDADYHVVLHNGQTGFCWQAYVDEAGQVVATGTRAEMPEVLTLAAEEYCQEQGFRHEVMEQPDGTRCGVCYFDDGTYCKAWAYYEGLCKVH